MSKSRIVKTATVIMVLMITVMFSQEGEAIATPWTDR